MRTDKLKQMREELHQMEKATPPSSFLQEMDYMVRCFDAFAKIELFGGDKELLSIPNLIESVRKNLEQKDAQL